ncbi:hypothetical protein [Streptomyces althioticus]|uniref:hypothetical protein n=1 Tax=Streptomyces althioticus TaxID=83380 RepID=UPI00368428AD
MNDRTPHTPTSKPRPATAPEPRPHRMTVGDLKARLAEVPDWAAVEVITYDNEDLPREQDPHIDYSRGVLTIDAA